jgi:hypothetical protein
LYVDFISTCHIPQISYTEDNPKVETPTHQTPMLRAFATWFAKWRYRWNKEVEAGMHTWSARVAEQNAKASRELIVKMKSEADAFEARIKSMVERKRRDSGFARMDTKILTCPRKMMRVALADRTLVATSDLPSNRMLPTCWRLLMYWARGSLLQMRRMSRKVPPLWSSAMVQ